MLADCLTLYLPDEIFNSLYCQPYNSYNVSSENVVLNQLIIPCQITASILHQRLLLANSLQDVSAQKKTRIFLRVKTFLIIRQFFITVYRNM